MNKSFEEIMMMVGSMDSGERSLGLRYIGKHRYREALDICIYTLAEDEDDEVRAWAAWAMDQISAPETVEPLIIAMSDISFGVRSNAGWALVHMARRWSPNLVVPDVIDVLRETENEYTRQMAYLVLHHIGGEDARRAINQYWR